MLNTNSGPKKVFPLELPPPPPCDIPSGCCSFTGPWTVTRSSLRMLRRVAAFCQPGLCWMWHGVPFACQRRPVVSLLRLCWLLRGSFDCFCCPHTSVLRPSTTCLSVFPCTGNPPPPPPPPPPHMCSQNDQRDVGIILSRRCWGRPPPPPGTAGRAPPPPPPVPNPPSRHGGQGDGGLWETGLRAPHTLCSNFPLALDDPSKLHNRRRPRAPLPVVPLPSRQQREICEAVFAGAEFS